MYSKYLLNIGRDMPYVNLSKQQPSNGEDHCIELIFFDGTSVNKQVPHSDFSGKTIIINISPLPLSSEYPVAQSRFLRQGEFRHGFDIIIPPYSTTTSKTDYLTEQYDVLSNKRNIKVYITTYRKHGNGSIKFYLIYRSAHCLNTMKLLRN